jgi:hypothetical protein
VELAGFFFLNYVKNLEERELQAQVTHLSIWDLVRNPENLHRRLKNKQVTGRLY